MWLLRGLTPDFKTIADFRKDNRDAFKPVFRQFVLRRSVARKSSKILQPKMVKFSSACL
jgi:transposase